jgi:hypothetical protein
VVLFTEAEHVVLSRWFEERETRRSCTNGEEVERALASLGIGDVWFNDCLGPVEVAVARILLETDEALLPNWYCTEADGTEVSARKLRDTDEKPRRKVALRSRHLLTINWADSGPGFSWPESYRLVWVPGYDRHVLTASGDGGGEEGCAADAALAAIPPGDAELLERVGEHLRGHWCFGWKEGQEAWAYCFTEGLVSEATALAWRDEVWCEEANR